MHDIPSTVFVITASIGIFLYIYLARRKDKQMRSQYSTKPLRRSTYRLYQNPFENAAPMTLEELEDFRDLEAAGWQVRRTLHSNPIKSRSWFPALHSTMRPIQLCYRRKPRSHFP